MENSLKETLLKEKEELEKIENPTGEQKRTLELIKDRLELEGLTEEIKLATINFDGLSKRRINPSIDYIDGKCYIGLTLPCNIPKAKGENIEIVEKEHLSFITSDKEYFVAIPDELKERSLFFDEYFKIEPRWELDSIKQFVNGNPDITFKEVFNDIKQQFQKYIEFPHSLWYDIVSCYVIATYFFKLFKSFGILFLTGVKRAGKSKAGSIIACLSFNGVPSGLFSASGLFRAKHSLNATIVFDETEKLGKSPQRVEDIITILNNSYKDGFPVIKSIETRTGFEIKLFVVYTPTVIANVYGISIETLLDRCIILTMKRSINPKIINTEVDIKDSIFQKIRNKEYILALTQFERVKEINETLDVEISGRELEIWRPVLVIAKLLDKEIDFKKLIKFIQDTTKEKEMVEKTEEFEIIILKTMEDMVNNDWVSVKDITKKLIESGEDEKYVNEKRVGRVLTRLGFKEKRRVSFGIEYHITYQDYVSICRSLNVDIDYELFKMKMS